ncbi:hypothetical protein C8J56DRAFT_957881 [Mycena floridula]|nr:hypothetical protein C8J56DRAFT_957881 [Mycena floridula]
MLKFQNYARTVLRSSWAQHVRSLSTAIPKASSSTVLVKKQTGRGILDPTTIRDHFQHFGEISRIWSSYLTGSVITFASTEQAQNLLDSTTAGELTTVSGEIYRITPSEPIQSPASQHMLVMTFEPNVNAADIQKAFSKFGPVKKVTMEQERLATGELPYTAEFIVHFKSIEDAVKASSTLVSLPNGAVLQGKTITPQSVEAPTVLQYLLEMPWDKIRPGYNDKKFVKHLARAAEIDRQHLRWQVSMDSDAGLAEVLLKTKTAEEAKKIKAIPRIHNTRLVVKDSFFPLPTTRRRLIQTYDWKGETAETAESSN